MTSLQTGIHYPINLEALPIGWDKGYVGDFAVEIQPGFASGKHNKEGRGIPHIRPYNIDRLGQLDLTEIKSVAPEADIKRLHSGDVLFNNTNSPELIGKTAVVTAAGDWGFSNHMTRVVFSDSVSPKFAAYQLHYLWARGYFLHNCVKHVNQASVSSTTLGRAVPFVKPPHGQQDRIVAEIEKQFSRLDEAVASLKRTKANLKRYKAAVLKAAVEGKLTEDWRKHHPDIEPASKLLERILADRCGKYNGKGNFKVPLAPDISGLPPLPTTWVWSSVETICSEVVDCPHSTPKWESAGRVCLRTTEFRPGRLDLSDVRYVSLATYEARTQRLTPSENDIVYSREGGILGVACMIPAALNPCLGQRMMLLRLHSSFTPNFLMHWLNSPHLLAKVRKLTGGSASPHLNVGEVKVFPVPIAPVAEQKEIVAEVERRLSVIEELEAIVDVSLTRADRLRQSILSQAFSGRLLAQGSKGYSRHRANILYSR